jgi:Tfp pilus assembly protein PilN
MESSASDRLQVIYTAYKLAFERRASDLKDAKTSDDVHRILANVDALELAYLKAARQSLDGHGGAIETAYRAALAAAEKVEEAYRQGKALADRIRAVAAIVTAVGSLLEKAAA